MIKNKTIKCPKCGSLKNYKFGHRPRWYHGVRTLVACRMCDNCGHEWRIK